MLAPELKAAVVTGLGWPPQIRGESANWSMSTRMGRKMLTVCRPVNDGGRWQRSQLLRPSSSVQHYTSSSPSLARSPPGDDSCPDGSFGRHRTAGDTDRRHQRPHDAQPSRDERGGAEPTGVMGRTGEGCPGQPGGHREDGDRQ